MNNIKSHKRIKSNEISIISDDFPSLDYTQSLNLNNMIIKIPKNEENSILNKSIKKDATDTNKSLIKLDKNSKNNSNLMNSFKINDNVSDKDILISSSIFNNSNNLNPLDNDDIRLKNVLLIDSYKKVQKVKI